MSIYRFLVLGGIRQLLQQSELIANRDQSISFDKMKHHSLPGRSSGEIYLRNSLKFVRQGCRNKDKMLIDGGRGDDRMAMFRPKNRKAYLNSISSIFKQQPFPTLLFPANQDPQLSKELESIISAPNQFYLSHRQYRSYQKPVSPKLSTLNLPRTKTIELTSPIQQTTKKITPKRIFISDENRPHINSIKIRYLRPWAFRNKQHQL